MLLHIEHELINLSLRNLKSHSPIRANPPKRVPNGTSNIYAKPLIPLTAEKCKPAADLGIKIGVEKPWPPSNVILYPGPLVQTATECRSEERKAKTSIVPETQSKITELTLAADGSCRFFYNPSGNSMHIDSGDKIYIVGEMTDNERVELSKRIVNGEILFATDLKVPIAKRYTFHYVTNKDIVPFLDSHFPMEAALSGYAFGKSL